MRIPGSITAAPLATVRVVTPVRTEEPPSRPAAVVSAPVPSGSVLALRSSAVSGSAQSLFDLRLGGVTSAGAPPDGRVFCQAALLDIRQRAARGEKCRVVFDLDNTLFDSRARTLEIAKAFDAANGTAYFSSLTVDKIGVDGAQTCLNLGLPAEVAQAFQAHWNTEFWNGETMKYDTPIAAMVQLAKDAKAAGADVAYLTGRIQQLSDHSLAQLVRAGLPDATADHLFSKPDLQSRTGPFKAAQLDAWLAANIHIGFFVTEGRRDIATIQKSNPSVPCVLLQCSLERSEQAVNPDTPQLPPEF